MSQRHALSLTFIYKSPENFHFHNFTNLLHFILQNLNYWIYICQLFAFNFTATIFIYISAAISLQHIKHFYFNMTFNKTNLSTAYHDKCHHSCRAVHVYTHHGHCSSWGREGRCKHHPGQSLTSNPPSATNESSLVCKSMYSISCSDVACQVLWDVA